MPLVLGLVCGVAPLARALDNQTASSMDAGVVAGTLARENDFVFQAGTYITPRAAAAVTTTGGVTSFSCLLPPDNGTTGANVTVPIGSVRRGMEEAYPVFPLPLYNQTVTIQFDSPAAAAAAYLRPLPIYHGHLYALAGRFDDNDWGTVLSCEGLGAGGVLSTAFANGLYYQNSVYAKQPPSIAQWARVLAAGSSFGTHSWHHGVSPSDGFIEYDDAGNPIPAGLYDFSYPNSTPKFHFLDVLHPRLFYEAVLDTLIMSAAGPGNGYGTNGQFQNWINAGHYAFSQLKVEYPSSNVVWEEYNAGVILDSEKLIVRAREATHAQSKVNPLTYAAMGNEIVAYGGAECWQTTWNDYGAYRYQYYHSPVLKASVTGNEATFAIHRPERIDLNNDIPLTWEVVGAASNNITSVTVVNGTCQPVSLVAGPHSDRYAFDLFHDPAQKQLPVKIGFIGQYGDGVYRPDNFIQTEDPDFPGLTANLTLAGGQALLTLHNGSGAALENIVVTYRFPSGYVPETARVRLPGTLAASANMTVAPLDVAVSPEENPGEWIAAVQLDFTRDAVEGRLHVLAQSSDAAIAGNPPLPALPTYETLAYCDLNRLAGQPDEAKNVNTIRNGGLIDFHTGLSTGITVALSGGTPKAETWYETFGGITDAYRAFGEDMDNLGYMLGNATFTFSGLDPAKKYEVVFTSAAQEVVTDPARITISSADHFLNQSSPMARMTGQQVVVSGTDGETSEANFGNNVESGLVIRYTDIAPGSDGQITFTATGAVYLSGYKIGVRGGEPPSNTPPLAYIDAPASNATFTGGGVVSFQGHASDAEDGVLAGNNLAWQITRVGTGVVHAQNGTNGTYTLPGNITESTTFEIKLQATDSSGAIGTDARTFTVLPGGFIGYDDFDGDSHYLSRTVTNATNAGNNVWGIMNRSTVAADEIVDTSVAAGGVVALNPADNFGFLRSAKTDNFLGSYRSAAGNMVYTFDITGAANLTLSMDWAASANEMLNPRKSSVTVTASIDGGAAQTIFSQTDAPGNWSYTMESGNASITANETVYAVVNGVKGAQITHEFQTFTANITGNGSVLAVVFTGDGTANRISYGVDNLVLRGDPPAAPPPAGYAGWIGGHGLSGSPDADRGFDYDGDGRTNLSEYGFDLDPTVREYGRLLASQTGPGEGGNVTLTLAFNGNSSKTDINYVVRRAADPGFAANTTVGFWNGTANWTTVNATYFTNQTQSGGGAVKAINVHLDLPPSAAPRQFLKVDVE